MRTRRLGKTGFEVTEISLGTWQVGGTWGSGFDEANAEAILEDALDRGINFIDTADVYENRQSEAAVARVVRKRDERPDHGHQTYEPCDNKGSATYGRGTPRSMFAPHIASLFSVLAMR